MERAGFMTCSAASHQGAIKEPTASLFRMCETHLGLNYEPDVASFIHSVTKQNAVVMNGLLITDSPNRSKPQIRSLTKHRCKLLGDAHQMILLELLLFCYKI